ncbi:hybrid sensor histidine kinase/response regulator [Massilia rhizosphaerae]|uniref:hybrid sensor histidine kinase/response regulator n=1 Tax=Massilia rhizosphaerae TaxID=2784389 RepID=UPI0018DD3F4C|nr:response regulator [Massilia rhizosphaerae]
MTDEQFQQKLRGIFTEEAREHLAQIDVGLVALEQAGEAQRGALLERVLKVLHTLKGAARTVDELELERLCHALEGVLAAVRDTGVHATAEQFDLLHKAAAGARQVVDSPGPRSRKVAGMLAAQADAVARALPAQADAAPAAPDFTPDVAPDVGPDPEPADSDGVTGDGGGERIRVDRRCIDSIRAHAEALLPVELKLRHHVDELRALAGVIAARRREGPAEGADDGARIELACTRLAASLEHTGKELHGVRGRLFDAALETALVPSAAALNELPALVRNLARGHGKEVRLDMRGVDVDIDRRVLGIVREALIHLVTNAVDHGIETPAQRSAAGKDPVGRIAIAVTQRDARMVSVRVDDDGAGIDTEAVARAAAGHAGLTDADVAQMSEQQRLQLALRAGVSTRAEVTPVSGRGMGLSIVADKVEASGGQIVVATTPGAGSSFELLLPVGVASLRALVVEVAGARYAVPLAGLEAVRSETQADIRTVEGRETVLAGARVLPLVRLAALFGTAQPGQEQGSGVVIVAQAAGQAFGMLVDAIVAEQDLLPKSFGPLLRRVRWFSGAAQLGDGTLAPVLALEDVAARGLAGGAAAPEAPAPAAGPRRVLVVEDSVTSRLLLKHILEGAGCSVDTAVDGLDALSRLRAGRYDAVVSDVEMPNMDGLALTAGIRANPATAELPVILVTSLQTPEQREAGLRAGADAYFTKGSFDQDRLLATVRRVAGMEAP